jgi:two-component system sensor histidine kinase KdpD
MGASVTDQDPGAQRGRLRIYLGAAPGVGKTYAMLGEGHRRAGRGTDVVVAYVETHGRPNTAGQLDGLELVPRREIAYRGQTFTEMDLGAVLERRPEVALVDELAHTNVPGSRNEKRWQDVEELLAAGIDVVSTVNVQHLESLNDVVERITGATQRETVPDRVVRAADQVELVDMTAEALRRRMHHGNIYAADKVEAALGNYFRVGNLTALRELALLWLADKVDDALLSYQDHHGIDHAWETRERVVVALTGAPSGEVLIRRAARIAGRARGDLIGVHIRADDGLEHEPSAGLERQRTLLADLGGAYHEVVGTDVASDLVHFARAERATQVVLGATRRSRWRELWRGSIVNAVVRASGEFDIHVISRPDGDDAPIGARRIGALRSPLSPRRRLAGWVFAAVALPALTVVLALTRDHFGLPGELMAYVLLVVGAAAIGGTGPGVASAVASGLLVNWYFTPPYYTLTVAEAENVAALTSFVLVAVAISLLVARAERRAAAATRAGQEAEALARVAAGLALDDDPLPSMLDRVRSTFQLDAASLFVPTDGGWQLVHGAGEPVPASPEDATLQVPAGDVGVLALSGVAPTVDDQLVLGAFAAQMAIALEQRQLRREAADAAVVAEGDALRTALLRAVSHDLRTPLSSIKASVSSLLQDDIVWTDDDRQEFLATIDEETDRLNSLVGNLLDMSRLETGVLQMTARPVGWEELVAAATAGISPRDGHTFDIAVPETLAAVHADPGLLERALGNVVANAVRFSGGQPVRIEADEVGDRVELRVIDRGPGVPAHQRPQLFEPFQRLGDTGGDGVGLGLAVAAGFVTAMGGRITADETPGGGLTMTLSLPRAEVGAA